MPANPQNNATSAQSNAASAQSNAQSNAAPVSNNQNAIRNQGKSMANVQHQRSLGKQLQHPKFRGKHTGNGKSIGGKQPDTGGVKKKKKWKAGTVALREIRKFQRSTELLMRKAPFARWVRSIISELQKSSVDFRISRDFHLAVQEAMEYWFVRVLEDANKVAIHAGRITVTANDVALAVNIASGAA